MENIISSFFLDIESIDKEDRELIFEFERRCINFIETDKKLVEAMTNLVNSEKKFEKLNKILLKHRELSKAFQKNKEELYDYIVNVYKKRKE